MNTLDRVERKYLKDETQEFNIGDTVRVLVRIVEGDKEREQAFDETFIALARSVYVENDKRAALKKRINSRLGSRIVEEKSYRDYRR